MDSQMMSEIEAIGRAHAARRRAVVDFMAQYDLALLKSTFAESLAEYKQANDVQPQVEQFLRACMESNHVTDAAEVFGTGRAIREIQEALAWLERERDPEEEPEPSLAERVVEFLDVFHRKVIANLIANNLALLDDGEDPSPELYEKAYCRTVDQIGGMPTIERFYMRARSFTGEILELLDSQSDAQSGPETLRMARTLLSIERLRARRELDHYRRLYVDRRGTPGLPGPSNRESAGA
ncbi:MAG: hypothetical protein AAB434_02705 [Planctomycetota bacterium]